ncbi:alkaline shock response membrane anchor protein AmaP [Coraliomargarita akajimensis]|uniref:Alkaline shock response membrane anchor protein AmaP n=1 Tax=Coraliomargarita akajimensis (strain DSM 45221 / IAM 15411 / JCM 23193 / KCTC 12865 / 04OKA010-24) TaxID=583355 RepID=D5EKD5_CORAD|nr:alkaline shock response membrane anchor protein AmaP [Coraliomargarita akajimensis]ADE54884.1 hypothetical protein Caka_1866 [Coraliomargarita akajimensis DSM 45221]
MNCEAISEFLGQLSFREYLYIAGAALAFLCFLIYLFRRQPSKVIAYKTGNGRVMVSRSAIVELVQTSCAQIDEVHKPQVKIKRKGSTTHLQVGLKLSSGGKLRDVEQTLQGHLREALTDNLGIEKVGRIDINATGFKSGKLTHSTASSSPRALSNAEEIEEEASSELELVEPESDATEADNSHETEPKQ